MEFVELFAGCGGLSLGLKSVGFNLVMANELSPMAAESYSFNFFHEDLSTESTKKAPKLKKTLWLQSHYPVSELSKRLREDPRNFPSDNQGFCDLSADGENLAGSLVVGSIIELNNWLKQHPSAAHALRNSFGQGSLDLVSGGPPCQSFSMAGLRQLDSDKNTLPWEFAKFVQTTSPKFVLLENVTGILRPFKNKDGDRFYAWFELAKAFASIGYIPLCLHINAKFAGVPQNRPRFILLGVREDILRKLDVSLTPEEKILFQQPLEFFHKNNQKIAVTLDDLVYRDISKQEDLQLFQHSFLKYLIVNSSSFVSVAEAIDDLRTETNPSSEYTKSLQRTFSKVLSKRSMQNHELRANNPLVKRRFRVYQVLQKIEPDTRKKVLSILKGESQSLDDVSWKSIASFDFLLETGKYKKFNNKSEFISFLQQHTTKKQTQKALSANHPAPAALSIPDDACHYHREELRTLTVREMARIQSFPDNFTFRSKVTTGGKMRAFEVPQYTQVGNAVPPLLGHALGLVISSLLSRLNETE